MMDNSSCLSYAIRPNYFRHFALAERSLMVMLGDFFMLVNDPKRRALLTERKQWDDLVTELDKELLIYRETRHQLGGILYRVKVHLQKHGLDKSHTGRWESILRERHIEKSTARDWVVKYQQAEGIPLDKCFFEKEMLRVKKTRKSHKYRENNRAGTALMESDARIDVAPDEKKDESPQGRSAVECVFILTYQERLRFIDAVSKLGPLRATQRMYSAVVTDKEEEQADAAAGA